MLVSKLLGTYQNAAGSRCHGILLDGVHDRFLHHASADAREVESVHVAPVANFLFLRVHATTLQLDDQRPPVGHRVVSARCIVLNNETCLDASALGMNLPSGQHKQAT